MKDITVQAEDTSTTEETQQVLEERTYQNNDNYIGSGHWVFAGLFFALFIGYLVWSYRKDFKETKFHYKGLIWFVLTLLVIVFLLFVFKDKLK